MTYVEPKTPDAFSVEKKAELVLALQQRLPQAKCPMCAHQHFAVVDGYFTNTIQSQLSGFALGGPAIPAVAIICSNCGFISQHALGALGVLQDKGADK